MVPRLVGSEVRVPLVTGELVPYVNLDYAASAPALAAVADAVAELLSWYSSVHRGAGFKSQVTTAAYEGARTAVRAFVGARDDDVVVFTRNTTDAMNLLASALPADAAVVAFDVEHHANMLPWRDREVRYLPTPTSPHDVPDVLARALLGLGGRPVLVAVTGASNVTGEIWPVAEVVGVAHAAGARVVMDAAQLAPHRPIDTAALDVDFVAFSGHKLYAPYGAGVLVGRPVWIGEGRPFLAGGGAVRFVTLEEVHWSGLPDRQEAGSPDVLGAVALGVACRTLQQVGMQALAAEEARLHAQAEERLRAIPGIQVHTLWDPAHPRIGVLTFTLEGYPDGLLATILSAEYGIGVRHGCFCAHPLMVRLLGLPHGQVEALRERLRRDEPVELPGAVRASMGLGTTREDLDALVDAVETVAKEGPRWRYAPTEDRSDYVPVPETRALPALPFPLEGSAVARGESS